MKEPKARGAKTGPGRKATSRRPAPATQQIVVRDLTFSCSIGLSDEERARTQRLRLNLEVELRPHLPREDRITEVVNYSTLVERLRAVCRDSRIRLLETLAGEIAEACFFDDRVRAVRLRIEKLDRYADIGGIGVEMTFRRGRGPSG